MITTDHLIEQFTYVALWILAFILGCVFFECNYLASFSSGVFVSVLCLIGVFKIAKLHEESQSEE